MWWDDFLPELTFDSYERLGKHFYDLPTATAAAFAVSVSRIPGTHVNSKILEMNSRKIQKEADHAAALDGKAGVAAIGGKLGESTVKKDDLSDYWKEILGYKDVSTGRRIRDSDSSAG